MLLIISNSAHSFNYDECRKTYLSPKPNTYWNVFSSFTYTVDLTTIPTDATTSSAQFFSSTGECKGIDFRDRTKLEYIAANFEQLKIDTAKGNGEYLNGLGVLYECGEEDRTKLNNLLQSNFELIYVNNNFNKQDMYNSPSQAFSEINGLISFNRELKTCSAYF